jgi:hypothetical protein
LLVDRVFFAPEKLDEIEDEEDDESERGIVE